MASVPSASSSRTWAAASRPRSPTRPTQPPRWKPSSPAGSWMTPSGETFSLMMIILIAVLLWLALSVPLVQAPRRRERGPPPPAQFAPRSAPIQDGPAARRGRKVTVRVVTADLISRARAGDGDAFRQLTEPYRRGVPGHCARGARTLLAH